MCAEIHKFLIDFCFLLLYSYIVAVEEKQSADLQVYNIQKERMPFRWQIQIKQTM